MPPSPNVACCFLRDNGVSFFFFFCKELLKYQKIARALVINKSSEVPLYNCCVFSSLSFFLYGFRFCALYLRCGTLVDVYTGTGLLKLFTLFWFPWAPLKLNQLSKSIWRGKGNGLNFVSGHSLRLYFDFHQMLLIGLHVFPPYAKNSF